MKTAIFEYGKGAELTSVMSEGTNKSQLITAIEIANSRIQNSLDISARVLYVADGEIKASGIAGVVQVTKDLELEIIPKFLGSEAEDWKATLYLLSTLSKYGSILTSEKIHSNSSYLNSLYEIAGRILAENYTRFNRKPIRQYRKEVFYDFSIDGEIDFDDYYNLNAEGIKQSTVKFDRSNIFNGTIQTAMKIVLPYVSDNKVRHILKTAIMSFGKQNTVIGKKQRVPSRNSEWKNTYNLAYDICHGLGSSFEFGQMLAPGFVVDTWKLWEWLLTVGIEIGAKKNVVPQALTYFGYKEFRNTKYKVNVFPDVAIYKNAGDAIPCFLVDAKYKLLPEEKNGEVLRADLYEAYAFCKATKCKTILLAYPTEVREDESAGTVRIISKYHIGDIIVYAVKISFGSIRTKGGIFTFGNNLFGGLESALTY